MSMFIVTSQGHVGETMWRMDGFVQTMIMNFNISRYWGANGIYILMLVENMISIVSID